MDAKKLIAAFSVIVVLSTVGFAASLNTADSKSIVYPYPYYYGDDYPNVLILKGVAVDDEIEPAVFVGIGEKFENSFLIIGKLVGYDGSVYKILDQPAETTVEKATEIAKEAE